MASCMLGKHHADLAKGSGLHLTNAGFLMGISCFSNDVVCVCVLCGVCVCCVCVVCVGCVCVLCVWCVCVLCVCVVFVSGVCVVCVLCVVLCCVVVCCVVLCCVVLCCVVLCCVVLCCVDLTTCEEEERKMQTIMMYQLGQDWFQARPGSWPHLHPATKFRSHMN